MNDRPPTKRISTTASVGMVAVGILIASALGSLAIGRITRDRLQQTGPQKRIEPNGKVSSDIPSHSYPSLPVLSQLSHSLVLVDQHDQPFNIKSFAGKANLVNFVFTTCPNVCPLITRTMKGLEAELSQKPEWQAIQLLSISVDPEKDTPATLLGYANAYSINDNHWRFLTGDRALITSLIRDGFKLSINSDAGVNVPIIHSEQFALVDDQGIVRGYYNPQETLGRKTLMQDTINLAGFYVKTSAQQKAEPPTDPAH